MKSGGIQKYLSLAIKLILILSIINAVNEQLWYIMSTNIFLLILMFIPQIVKQYQVRIPIEFEWLLLMFVISTLFIGKISGIIAPVFFGIAVAFIGFMILAILYSSNQIKKNYFLIIFFSLSFTIAFGAVLELLKYYVKIILGLERSLGMYKFSMQNMALVIAGAIIASAMGYIYMRFQNGIIRKAVKKVIDKNPKLFMKKTDLPNEILELIKKGENEKIEFKSTLRTNLHTKEIDRRIEFSTLKTITALINSHGGALLLGVTDKGEIFGVEQDKFENIDKFNLHLTNLIKEKIGQKYLHLISIQDVLIEGKTVVKVECRESDSPVFLKLPSGEEEFYMRSGPASMQLKASGLVEYIRRRFEKS